MCSNPQFAKEALPACRSYTPVSQCLTGPPTLGHGQILLCAYGTGRGQRGKLSHAQPFLLPSWVLLRMVVTAQAALQAAGGSLAHACVRACVRLFSSFCNAEQSMPGFQRCLLIPTLPRASAWTLTYSSWSQGHRLSVGVMVKGSVVDSGGAGLSSCFALSS